MNSTWVFLNLRKNLPLWVTSLTSSSSSSLIIPSSGKFILNQEEISRLLSICGKEGYFRLGSSVHCSLIKNPQIFKVSEPIHPLSHLVIWNSLLYMYLKCGTLSNAAKLFDEMTVKDTVSWNTIILGFLRKRYFDVGLDYFKLMYSSSGVYSFDKGTITTILSACKGLEFSNVIKMIHGLAFVHGYDQVVAVGNALITSYFSCECFHSGRGVFMEMTERNVISWTAMTTGLARNQFYEESLKMFVKMRCGSVCLNSLTYLSSLLACSGLQALKEGCQIHGLVLKLGFHSDMKIESTLMDMYSKCGSVKEAWQIFESAQVLDEVSMTVIISGFAQNGCVEEAVKIFVRMNKEGSKIDPDMVLAILGVCGVDTSLALGKQIHSLVIKKGFLSNTFVSNGLINMYSKCGKLEESVKVFDRMAQTNSASWNSIIAGFARHGNGSTALQLYEEMKQEDIEPTDVTFLSLLHACSHVGLIDKGLEFFKSMERDYGISPRKEHYSSVVDILGRAGLLTEAKSFIEGLPVKPDVQLWQALLGACRIHGNLDMGNYAAKQLALAAPHSPVPYILMANIYSSEGKWKERAETIKRMKEAGVAKETGISWIEIKKQVHSFVADDRTHPQTEIISGVLLMLFRHLRDEGYVPDKRFILHCWDEDGNKW